jgi:prepilin-type N-terminal cleavage/methylation domain-containing protein
MLIQPRKKAFTLAELLVSIAILALLILIVTKMIDSASTLTTMGNNRMDADSQARPVLDRMAVDLAQMVKRSDVDFFGKNTAAPNSSGGAMVGNDQIALFSTVPGYYPPTGSQSPISVVSYRVNSQQQVERMGKGLVWNGVLATPTATPTPNPTPTPYPAMQFLPMTILGTWPTATNATLDSDYELIGPNVFRFEYYYLLKNGTLSITPWDTGAGHTTVSGMRDVTAIAVAVAAIDPKSRTLLSDAQVVTLAGGMSDFVTTMGPGGLAAQWQAALNAITGMPRPAITGIRIYQRYFYLSPTF